MPEKGEMTEMQLASSYNKHAKINR